MTEESNRNSKDETAEDLSFSSKDLDEYNNGIKGLSLKRYVSKEKRTEMIAMSRHPLRQPSPPHHQTGKGHKAHKNDLRQPRRVSAYMCN